jgi:ADP-ribose pyrophosphatase YjhB (NUDIX family)
MDWTQFDKGVYLVTTLAIIHKDGKVLIGKRINDPHVKELTWVFPGGRPDYGKDLEESLREAVREKTGLEVNVGKLVFARTFKEKNTILLLYYYAEPIGGEEKTSETVVELKWVKPTEVTEYFTTSVDTKVMEFLENLERGNI